MKNIFKSVYNRAINHLISKKRGELATQYLNGTGIEIGALHQPLKGLNHCTVKYVDRMSSNDLSKHYPEINPNKFVSPDVIDDGEKLENFAPNSLDFIVANHFLEHCENPISTIKMFLEKLRDGGKFYLAIPDKRYTFDQPRPLTTLEHVLEDYNNGPSHSRYKHYYEWVKYTDAVVNKIPKVEIEKRAKHLLDTSYSIHFHVWDFDEIKKLFGHLSEKVFSNLGIVRIEQNHSEVVVIGKKLLQQ